MLRWIVVSALASVLFAMLGLGQIVPLAPAMQSFFLAMAALAGTVLFSSYDAYETQDAPPDE